MFRKIEKVLSLLRKIDELSDVYSYLMQNFQLQKPENVFYLVAFLPEKSIKLQYFECGSPCPSVYDIGEQDELVNCYLQYYTHSYLALQNLNWNEILRETGNRGKIKKNI